MSEEVVKERFIKHMDTYPEHMRYKVNPGNCLALMNWAYIYGRQTKEEEFIEKLIELIKQKQSSKFNAEEVDDDDWGRERLIHNKNIEADIIDLNKLIEVLEK